jgi:hypothetical protein
VRQTPRRCPVPAAAARLLALVLVVVAGPGCRGRERERTGNEGAQVKEAVEKFLDFGMSNENYDHGKREKREAAAKVRAKVVNNTMSPRLRLELDIELPYDLGGAALENAMLDNARRHLAGTEFQAARVRAWPGPLKRFGGTMGYAVVAVDGQGWDGERLGYRESKVMLADGAPRPNALDYKILCALEAEAGKLLDEKAAGDKGKAPAKVPAKSVAAAPALAAPLRAKAEASVAKALGLQVEAVRNAAAKSEAYYLKE